MGSTTPVAQSSELFRQPLCEMLSAKHPLVKLADVIDWDKIERSFGAHFQTITGRHNCLKPFAPRQTIYCKGCREF